MIRLTSAQRNLSKVLRVVSEKLKEQEEAEKMTEEKVAEWIKTRIRKLEGEHRENDSQ